MAVFSAMQVKSERQFGDILPNNQQTLPTSTHQQPQSVSTLQKPTNTLLSAVDMQCGVNNDKSSPYSLWAEYFDSFPILTEFDLRSGVNNSTGSSVISSSTGSCGSWSSPGSGSPFSECEAEESPFDDSSVPTSVIDEIVQTLKMDGYNFDHLSDELIDMPQHHQMPVKHELDMTNQPCYMQNPVYTSLHPPKLQQMDHSRKYNMTSNSTISAINAINNNTMSLNLNHTNSHDNVLDDNWCTGTPSNITPLPPISMSLQQIQSNNQLQQTHQQLMPIQQICQQQQAMQHQQQQQQLQTASYSTSMIPCTTPTTQYSSPVFPTSYSMHSTTEVEPYKYNVPVKSPATPQPPPLTQACDKPIETKPRRRRSANSNNRVEKPHVCKECGAAFKLSANLKQHLVIHTGEKPFSCEICKAMFTRLSSLKTHHRLHTGEKPHICPFCSAAFADRSAMKAHKRIHTGERPYKCQVCSTSFTQLSHLNAHKRTHTGEKPYACSICNTTFKQLGHLKRHEKSHVCSRV